MQFASKMMLVPFSKESREKCINMRSESEKILKNKKLNNTDKLTEYRQSIAKQKNEKRKESQNLQKETQVDTETQAIEETKEQPEQIVESSVTKNAFELELEQQISKLRDQLKKEQQNNKKLLHDSRLQKRAAKTNQQKLNALENVVTTTEDAPIRPSRKRKIFDWEAPRNPYNFEFAQNQAEPPVEAIQPKEQVQPKKLLTKSLVQKLDVMPEEADQDPDFPSIGRYDRQFVTPNKRSTRSLLNWKQY